MMPAPSPFPSADWRLLVTAPAVGAENMALDEALMNRARTTGEWTLRVYAWSQPTLSFGRNQSVLGKYDRSAIADRRLGVVRRPTGGRSILHHREITYSVTAPSLDAGDLKVSYSRINRILLAALERLGAPARLAAPTKRASGPSAMPCFDEPSAGEIMLGGRKLAGSAQWRTDGALLQHGSILVQDDQSSLVELMADGSRPIAPPATLADALGRPPTLEEFARAMANGIRDVEGVAPAPLDLEPEVRAATTALVVRYSDEAWTWRR